jgi:prephenate dehydrogenase
VSAADAESDFPLAPFRTIAIVGLGLIGGSLALAIRERWRDVTIVGVDRGDVLADAVARQIITRGAPSAAALATAADIDLVVLAAPVLQNIACLRDLASASRPLLVTDVGSTKQGIVTAARDLGSRITFIGGHPIAGAAHAGLAHARADLFRHRPWIFTPSSKGDEAALQQLRTFVSALGAEPAVLTADEHDRVMAYVSHLPQLVSSALMRSVGNAVGAPGLALSGPGLADTTRLASSPASIWTDILQSNAAHVREALDALMADLQAIRDQLDAPPAATAWLDEAARWRAHLRNGTRID